ncbi:MAG: hypothetical protein ACO2PN_08560 [Pyrobaculum sp.]|jgi:hypothetical protein
MEPQTPPNPVISPQVLKNAVNIYITAVAIPGHVIMHDKNSVVISGQKLAEVLSPLYEAGFRYVEAVVEVAGQRIAVDAAIYSKHDKRRNRAYHWLYPLQPGQSVLRDMFYRHRSGAARHAKRPMPVIIHQIAVALKQR